MNQNTESLGKIILSKEKSSIERPMLSVTEFLILGGDVQKAEAILQENRIEYSVHGYYEKRVKEGSDDYVKEKEELETSLVTFRIKSIKGSDTVETEAMRRIKSLLEAEGITIYSQDLWISLGQKKENVEDLKLKE